MINDVEGKLLDDPDIGRRSKTVPFLFYSIISPAGVYACSLEEEAKDAS